MGRRPSGPWVVSVVAALVAGAATHAQSESQEERLARAYLDGLIAIWEQDASVDDIEALSSLLAEDAVYEHPRVGISIEGRAAIVAGMTGFLGTTRKPSVTGLTTVVGPGVAAVGFDLTMESEGPEGWVALGRRQVLVLGIADGQIVRVTDHW